MLVCLIVIVLGISTCWVPFGLICLLGWQRNVVCLRYKIGVQCSIYQHVATNFYGDGHASQHVCRTALPANIMLMCSCSPEPNIKWPMLPREPIYVWNHLSMRTIRFRSQPTVWGWILVRAIQYKGWSTVSGIILLSLIWYKLHSSVDARWIAGIKANRWEQHNTYDSPG